MRSLSSIRSLSQGDWSSEIHGKKVRWQKWMAADFNVRKIYIAAERMDGYEYYWTNNFFGNKHTIAERIAQANNGWLQDIPLK